MLTFRGEDLNAFKVENGHSSRHTQSRAISLKDERNGEQLEMHLRPEISQRHRIKL